MLSSHQVSRDTSSGCPRPPPAGVGRGFPEPRFSQNLVSPRSCLYRGCPCYQDWAGFTPWPSPLHHTGQPFTAHSCLPRLGRASNGCSPSSPGVRITALFFLIGRLQAPWSRPSHTCVLPISCSDSMLTLRACLYHGPGSRHPPASLVQWCPTTQLPKPVVFPRP